MVGNGVDVMKGGLGFMRDGVAFIGFFLGVMMLCLLMGITRCGIIYLAGGIH